jgi:hypothetical protein
MASQSLTFTGNKAMTIPSVKTIASIEWLDKVGDPTAIAKQIRKVMEFYKTDDLLAHCEDDLDLDWRTGNYVWRYNLIELQLWVIDKLLDCHGVECIQKQYGSQDVVMEYCNTGQSDSSTVAYDYKKRKFLVTSWGQWVERNDPNGNKY